MVFDQCDVKTGFAPELDVGAGEEVEGCLLETALWKLVCFSGGGGFAGVVAHFLGRRRGDGLLGWVRVLAGYPVLRTEDSGKGAEKGRAAD